MFEVYMYMNGIQGRSGGVYEGSGAFWRVSRDSEVF